MTTDNLTPAQQAEIRKLVAQGISEHLARLMVTTRTPAATPVAPGGISGLGLDEFLPGFASTPPPTLSSTPAADGTGPPSLEDMLSGFGFGSEEQKPIPPPELTRSYREGVYDETLARNPMYANSSPDVQDVMDARGRRLDAQYVATAGDYPGYNSFLARNQSANPDTLSHLVRTTDFSSALPRVGEEDPTLQQSLLRDGSYNLLEEAVASNIHPALANPSRRVLAKRYAGGSQPGFVLQQRPHWEEILGTR